MKNRRFFFEDLKIFVGDLKIFENKIFQFFAV